MPENHSEEWSTREILTAGTVLFGVGLIGIEALRLKLIDQPYYELTTTVATERQISRASKLEDTIKQALMLNGTNPNILEVVACDQLYNGEQLYSIPKHTLNGIKKGKIFAIVHQVIEAGGNENYIYFVESKLLTAPKIES